MTSVVRATRDQVLAFRLAGHQLIARRPLREIEAEAALLGPIRACTSVEVNFDA